MKTTFNLLDSLYAAINVTAITSIIDGGIWRRKKPLNRQLQDVVLVPLDLRNADDIQPGIFIVNAFCKNHQNGLPNEGHLRTVGDALITALDGHEASDGSWFRIEVVSDTIMADNDDPAMSYISIRAAVQIENL